MSRTILLLVSALAVRADSVTADSSRGAILFEKLSCVECHSINGKGGTRATDLGQPIDRDFTPASLAATMWNHAPTMWAAMRDRGVRAGDLDEKAAADLFAYFYAARFFDKPGDAGRGKRLFSARHCSDCHGLTETKLAGARPVSQWAATGDPIALVDRMWNHAATMHQEFARRNLAWPILTSQDLSDILVYLRNLPSARGKPAIFELGSSERGQALFSSKGCATCHVGELALASRLRGQTLTDIAVDMWNHAPRMGVPAASLDLEEMRDVTSFLWAQQFFRGSGDAAAGKRVFLKKHCVTCHEDASSGARKLSGRQEPVTGAAMVSALWRHGPQMLSQIKDKGIPWPRFDGAEMSNLIAYLNSISGGK